MGELFPTKTRLRLLQDIDTEPGARQYRNGLSVQVAGWRRVNAAVEEMKRAGWIELDDQEHAEDDGGAYRLWKLTDAGRAIRDGAA